MIRVLAMRSRRAQRGELSATVLAVDLVLDAYSIDKRKGSRIFLLIMLAGEQLVECAHTCAGE